MGTNGQNQPYLQRTSSRSEKVIKPPTKSPKRGVPTSTSTPASSMASIGFLLAAAPSPDQALPAKVRRASSPPLLHSFSHSSAAAAVAALQHAETPHSFTYDRAIPSVRWPNLKLQELEETPKTQ